MRWKNKVKWLSFQNHVNDKIDVNQWSDQLLIDFSTNTFRRMERVVGMQRPLWDGNSNPNLHKWRIVRRRELRRRCRGRMRRRRRWQLWWFTRGRTGPTLRNRRLFSDLREPRDSQRLGQARLPGHLFLSTRGAGPCGWRKLCFPLWIRQRRLCGKLSLVNQRRCPFLLLQPAKRAWSHWHVSTQLRLVKFL